MKNYPIIGFSLVEILVSLFVVSLAAVNIAGLQKVVGDQSRDNFYHTAVLDLVSEKLEQVMQYDAMQDITDLDGTTETYKNLGNAFELSWAITSVVGASTLSAIREVAITVTWLDSVGTKQTFTHSEQISFFMLSEGSDENKNNLLSYPIVNLLGTNKVNYFEPKMGYQKDAYIIYDSQLFQASSAHPISDANPPPIDNADIVATGWKLLGRIDDQNLASLFTE